MAGFRGWSTEEIGLPDLASSFRSNGSRHAKAMCHDYAGRVVLVSQRFAVDMVLSRRGVHGLAIRRSCVGSALTCDLVPGALCSRSRSNSRCRSGTCISPPSARRNRRWRPAGPCNPRRRQRMLLLFPPNLRRRASPTISVRFARWSNWPLRQSPQRRRHCRCRRRRVKRGSGPAVTSYWRHRRTIPSKLAHLPKPDIRG